MAKMTVADWKANWHKHFSIKENWGDPFEIEKELVERLETLRMLAGRPVIIHCAYETKGHLSNSQHYLGRAADIHIDGLPLYLQFYFAIRAGFRGIGVYPHWNNPGLHIDVRELLPSEPLHLWYRDEHGLYRPINFDIFQKITFGYFDKK